MPARRPAWTAGFLSTPSARRATCRTPPGTSSTTNFYPRPPRGGRLMRWKSGAGPSNFYPRPPRGGRRLTKTYHIGNVNISIHALREEGDTTRQELATAQRRFLSTPSARRATFAHEHRTATHLHFYPRPPRGGRPEYIQQPDEDTYISIHALREEGDAVRTACALLFWRFLSTPSARRATDSSSVWRWYE